MRFTFQPFSARSHASQSSKSRLHGALSIASTGSISPRPKLAAHSRFTSTRASRPFSFFVSKAASSFCRSARGLAASTVPSSGQKKPGPDSSPVGLSQREMASGLSAKTAASA